MFYSFICHCCSLPIPMVVLLFFTVFHYFLLLFMHKLKLIVNHCSFIWLLHFEVYVYGLLLCLNWSLFLSIVDSSNFFMLKFMFYIYLYGWTKVDKYPLFIHMTLSFWILCYFIILIYIVIFSFDHFYILWNLHSLLISIFNAIFIIMI